MEYAEIIVRLEGLANPENVAGMARFGIRPARAFGISMPVLKKMAREIGKDHALALKLWASAIHEAKVLAAMIDDPAQVSQNPFRLGEGAPVERAQAGVCQKSGFCLDGLAGGAR
jgi:3-methyladenine DNA glycosylase AlkD